MNRRFQAALVIVAAFLALGAGSGEGGDMLQASDAAPDFRAKALDGTEFVLSEACAEEPVVLVFIRGFG